MTVHVGEITSEVSAARSSPSQAGERADEWEERARTQALLERISRDRSRTATGYGDD